jgi:Rod binding domain-containing protein
MKTLVQPFESATALRSGSPATSRVSPGASDTRLHTTAKQFEAMFMSEMLRLARPPSHAAGPFATGYAEKSWQVFMDQALGEAATASGGTGLADQIEKALRAAQGQSSSGAKR